MHNFQRVRRCYEAGVYMFSMVGLCDVGIWLKSCMHMVRERMLSCWGHSCVHILVCYSIAQNNCGCRTAHLLRDHTKTALLLLTVDLMR